MRHYSYRWVHKVGILIGMPTTDADSVLRVWVSPIKCTCMSDNLDGCLSVGCLAADVLLTVGVHSAALCQRASCLFQGLSINGQSISYSICKLPKVDPNVSRFTWKFLSLQHILVFSWSLCLAFSYISITLLYRHTAVTCITMHAHTMPLPATKLYQTSLKLPPDDSKFKNIVSKKLDDQVNQVFSYTESEEDSPLPIVFEVGAGCDTWGKKKGLVQNVHAVSMPLWCRLFRTFRGAAVLERRRQQEFKNYRNVPHQTYHQEVHCVCVYFWHEPVEWNDVSPGAFF